MVGVLKEFFFSLSHGFFLQSFVFFVVVVGKKYAKEEGFDEKEHHRLVSIITGKRIPLTTTTTTTTTTTRTTVKTRLATRTPFCHSVSVKRFG